MHASVDQADQHSVASSAGAEPDTSEADPVEVGKQKCSACASCCTAAALPNSVPGFSFSASPSTDLPSVLSAVVIFSTDGPERPPRISLL